RGKATWEKASQLIQVDGVDRESMNDIDPNEIESISILKDASATAVFGIRGANGVILITTKRGKEGKAKISFTTSASVLMPTKMVEQASSYDYARFHNQMMVGDKKSPMFSDAVIQKFKDGSDPIRFPDIQWADYIMKNATLQSQHNLNISGGTDRVRYFISAGAYTQGGLFSEFNLPYNLSYQYRRFNYRTNLDMDVTKTTTLSLNISGNVNNSDQPRTSQGSSGLIKNMYYATPFSSPGIIDGKLVNATNETFSDGLKLPFTGTTGMGYYGNGFSQSNNNALNVDVVLNQKLDFLTKGLSFKAKGSYNSSFTVNKIGSGGSVATYTPVLMEDGSIAYRKFGENTDVKYSYSTGKKRDWYMEASFNYNRTFGDHTVTALLLYNQQKEYYPKEYPDIPRGYVGVVGRATYDWKSRYMAEFNVGYNGSENFAPDLRFSYFPAGSIGWVMSEENFFRPLKSVVSFLKLRASIGLVGNDKIGGSRFMYIPDPYSVGLGDLANRVTNAAALPNAWGYSFGVDYGTLPFGPRQVDKNN
ncbi:MAG: SusC/RagA family TonB-linked outer membrane protein, partial [Bacteroides sp.]|nr:SusC/RagA family TonB-linked outer membrane protein [Bacteroides sp.]